MKNGEARRGETRRGDSTERNAVEKGRTDPREKEEAGSAGEGKEGGKTKGRGEERARGRVGRSKADPDYLETVGASTTVARRRYITAIYQRGSPSGTEATALSCPFPFYTPLTEPSSLAADLDTTLFSTTRPSSRDIRAFPSAFIRVPITGIQGSAAGNWAMGKRARWTWGSKGERVIFWTEIRLMAPGGIIDGADGVGVTPLNVNQELG